MINDFLNCLYLNDLVVPMVTGQDQGRIKVILTHAVGISILLYTEITHNTKLKIK